MARLTGPVLMTPAIDSTTRSTTALAAVGSRAYSEDGEFIYVKAAGATTASGQPVSVPTGSGGLSGVVIGDLDTGAFSGIADALFASGEYGYVRVKGPASVVVESGAVGGDLLQLSGTAGKLKKITTSGDAIAVALTASDNASAAAIDVYIKE